MEFEMRSPREVSAIAWLLCPMIEALWFSVLEGGVAFFLVYQKLWHQDTFLVDVQDY